jgi:hypothetical protein
MAIHAMPNSGQSSAAAHANALRAASQERLRRYAGYLDFYNGKQWAKTRPGRTNLVVNYTRTIVDKGISYLLGQGVNFAVPAGDDEWVSGRVGDRARRAEALLYRVYEENDTEAVDAQGAINGAVLGDTVFKVFWGQGPGEGEWESGRGGERGRIRVVNIDPFTFFPTWAADDPSTLLSVEVAYQLPVEEAARRYGDGETGRAGDGVKGSSLPVSPSPRLPVIDVVESWTDTEFVLTVGDSEVVRAPNPYGFIPFVHVPNARPANEFWGVSDLKDVAPLNRELNERMSDVADVIRFHSDPPVIFKGVREHGSLAVGPGTVWDLPEGADVELLEWRGQAPAVQDHIERVMRALHDVAETPRTAFGDSGRLLSGVALETELQPLIQKTLRKRIWWSAGLRRRNRFILRIAELKGIGTFAPYRSRIIWPPLLPTDSEAEVRNNVALVSAGLRSRRTAMDRLGEESPEAEMKLIEEERVQGAAPEVGRTRASAAFAGVLEHTQNSHPTPSQEK